MVRAGHMMAITTVSVAVHLFCWHAHYRHAGAGNWCGMDIAAQSFSESSWRPGSGDTTGVAKQRVLVSPTMLHGLHAMQHPSGLCTSPSPHTEGCVSQVADCSRCCCLLNNCCCLLIIHAGCSAEASWYPGHFGTLQSSTFFGCMPRATHAGDRDLQARQPVQAA